MIIRLQKFGKAMDSFLVGADPNAKGAVRFMARREQERAHGARPPRESPAMSWSMLAAKPRHAGQRLLGKIPRAVNRICRARGQRPVLTEHGCAIRDAFKKTMKECLHAERDKLEASQSGKPLTADELSLLIEKCDDFYARDFPTAVNSLLRKFVREKNRPIFSVFSDAHRQIFEKAVTAMKPELAGVNRDEAACCDSMWKLFDGANALAKPYLEKLAQSLDKPKEHPKLNEYDRMHRDRFHAAALAVMHAAQAHALARSEAGKAAAMAKISLLNNMFDAFYSAFFRAEVDALWSEFTSGAQDFPLEKLFWFAHRPAFSNAVEVVDSICVDAAWKLFTANRPDLPETPTGGARHMAKGWSSYTALMHACRAGIESHLKSRWDFSMNARTPMADAKEYIEDLETQAAARMKASIPSARETADDPSEYMHRFEDFLKARPDIYDKVLARRQNILEGVATRDAETTDYSSQYMKHFEAFLEMRSTVCENVLTWHRNILEDIVTRDVAPKRKVEPVRTISEFKSAYADTFNSLVAGLLARGPLSLNGLPAVHANATKVAESLAFQRARFTGEIPLDKLDAFKVELGRICKDIDHEIKMRSILNKRPISKLAN